MLKPWLRRAEIEKQAHNQNAVVHGWDVVGHFTKRKNVKKRLKERRNEMPDSQYQGRAALDRPVQIRYENDLCQQPCQRAPNVGAASVSKYPADQNSV